MNKLFILCLFLVCFTVYLNSLGNNFVLDDSGLVVNNPLIKSPKFLKAIFKTSLYEHPLTGLKNIPYDKMYRPLQALSYSLDYKLWGLNSFGFHLTNVIIHFLNSFLIYYLFYLLFNNTIAKLTAILFALHPIQTSVVSYISGRADLLVTFFVLLSMIIFFRFIKQGSMGYYAFSLLSGALALLCRESAMILFLYIFLVVLITKGKAKYFLMVIPFILLDLTYIILRFVIFEYRALSLHPSNLSFLMHLFNFLNIIPRYILILVMPLNLHLLRITSVIEKAFDIRAVLALAFISFYIYFIFRFRKNKLIFFSLLWFLIGIIPVFFFLDGYPGLKGAMMAESWLYLPCIGIFGLFSMIWNKNKILYRALFIIVLIFYASLTIINNGFWRDNITLYKNALAYTPQANPIRYNLINEYLKYNLYKDAKEEIGKFSIYCPECSQRYLLQGNYYYALNDIPEAVNNFKTALVINKYNFTAYYNLSLCFEREKDLDKAIGFALKSVNINPYFLDGLIQLGDLYSENKQYLEAGEYYHRASEVDPSNKMLEAKIKNAKR